MILENNDITRKAIFKYFHELPTKDKEKHFVFFANSLINTNGEYNKYKHTLTHQNINFHINIKQERVL